MTFKSIDYFRQIEAMEYVVEVDDRMDWPALNEADFILIGLSCTAKTPLAFYLGYHGYKVANLPLVPEIEVDLKRLRDYKDRIIGLTIDKEVLAYFRRQKLLKLGIKDDCSYLGFNRIDKEIEYANRVFEELDCPLLDVTDKEISSLASQIIEL